MVKTIELIVSKKEGINSVIFKSAEENIAKIPNAKQIKGTLLHFFNLKIIKVKTNTAITKDAIM